MATCPDAIKRLIDRFNQQSDHIRSPDYNEARIRIDFINPMMNELGWDIDNHQGFAEQYREVVHEDSVKVAGQTKAPDYSFRVGGARKFFLEAKKPEVDIRNNWEPAHQLRRYAWSAKLACSLLTDFEEFAIYDTRIQPRQLEMRRSPGANTSATPITPTAGISWPARSQRAPTCADAAAQQTLTHQVHQREIQGRPRFPNLKLQARLAYAFRRRLSSRLSLSA
jgi:hypothetical protein